MKRYLLTLLLLLCAAPALAWNFPIIASMSKSAGEPADVTAPEVSSASIATDGETVTVNFSESVVTTGYDNGDFDIDCTIAGTGIALNSISGSGSSRTFTAASTVNSGDTCNLDYTGGTDEIEDAAGNDLATFSNTAITNNSTQGGGGSTTWGPTAIASTEDDATGVGGPPLYNDCLDGDGSVIGGTVDYPLGLRWETTVTEGATVTDSELRFYAGYQDGGAVTMRCYGEDVASAGDYSSGSALQSRTPLTTAYVDVSVSGTGAWITVNSISLDAVIQEVASNSGFSGVISLICLDQDTPADANSNQIHTVSTGSCGTNFATLEVTYE